MYTYTYSYMHMYFQNYMCMYVYIYTVCFRRFPKIFQAHFKSWVQGAEGLNLAEQQSRRLAKLTPVDSLEDWVKPYWIPIFDGDFK